jgi:hypothetical protein
MPAPTQNSAALDARQPLLRLYISGPISLGEKFPPGHPTRKRYEAAFFDAEVALHERGHRTDNPMRLHVNTPNASWQSKLRVDIRYLVQCDGILMLPDWQKSKGACLERMIASSVDLDVFYSVEDVPVYVRALVDGK